MFILEGIKQPFVVFRIMFVKMNARNRSEARARSFTKAGFMLSNSLEHPFYIHCGLQIVWMQENVSSISGEFYTTRF